MLLKSYPGIIPLLEENDYKIISIFENSILNGFFFQNNDGLKGIIVIPKNNLINLDSSQINREIYNLIFTELYSIKDKYNLFFLNNLSLFPLEIFELAILDNISYYLNISTDNYIIKLNDNTLNSYIKYFNHFKTIGITLNELFLDNKYSHIKVFSFLYYWIFKILNDVLPSNENGYSLHDVGTELAYLPAMILKLENKDLMNVNITKIIASDYIPQNKFIINWINKYIKLSKNKIFNFNYLNLLDTTKNYPIADITIIVDVLEHLPDDDSVMKSILKLWDCTREILIIHVPIEKEKNKWYDHNILFLPEKLKKMSTYFKNGLFLSDSYKVDDYSSLSDIGFLIMKKI